MAWLIWKARFSPVLLSEYEDRFVDAWLRPLMHNQAVTYRKQGRIPRPEWLRLQRETVIPPDDGEFDQKGFIRLSNINRKSIRKGLAPFNPSLSMTDQYGREIRLLDSLLSTTYLSDVSYCIEGMLPEIDFEICSRLLELKLRNYLVDTLTFADKLFNYKEAKIRLADLSRDEFELSDIIKRSPQDRAAFKRCLSRREGLGVPKFLVKLTAYAYILDGGTT